MIDAPIKIKDFHGWELLYDPDTQQFFGRRDRKHIRAKDTYRSSQKDIQNMIHDVNATDVRKKEKKGRKPLGFRRWVARTAEEQTVTLQSYSNQGLRLMLHGGKAIREPTSYSSNTLCVIPVDVDAGPLHRAEEAVRQAAEEMRVALKDCTVEIKLGYNHSWAATDYHAEEDRVRDLIIKLNEEES